MRRLRVVHVVCSDAFAGVERHVSLLAAGQARVGHEVAVVGGEPAAMHSALAPWGVVHRRAATVAQAVKALGAFRAGDIVHVHMTAAEVAAMLAPGLKSCPVVATRHFAQRRGRSWPGRFVAPLVAGRLSAQISVSAYVAQAIDGRSAVVYPGVLGVGLVLSTDRNRTVLVVQRLEAEKRTDDAICVFAASGLATRGWRLKIVGDGAQRRRLETLTAKLGASSTVDFLGYRKDVPALMKGAGILLAPCDIEGLGLTVLEAMASGLPVVACAAGGHLETVGALPDSALYSPGDLSQGAEMLRRLAVDAPGRVAYGQALRDVQRNRFTVAAQVDGTDAVYRQVLGESAGG